MVTPRSLDADGRSSGVHIGDVAGGIHNSIIAGGDVHLILQGAKPVFAGVPGVRPHFVGRDELAAELANRLASGAVGALALEGLPGSGKTALAVALARHRAVLTHFKDGVLWASLGAGDQADAMRTLGAWASAFEDDVSRLLSLEERQQVVKTLISQRHLLLVIDNAWEVEAAEALRCGGPNCCHLLTTRDESVARAFAGPACVHTVPELDSDPAFRLLQELAPEACQADPAAARALARATGGLPLALELVGGYLATPEYSYFPDLSADALDKMSDPKRRLALPLNRLGRQGDKLTLQDTITLSLHDLPHEAEEAFYALGVFAPKPERFSRQAAEVVAQTDAATLALLAARNLIEIEDGDLTIQQTLADVARTRFDASARDRHRRYYLELANGDRDNWQRIEAAYGQIRWAWQSLPSDASRLDWIWAVQRYHRRRGLWREGLDWLEAGLEVARAEGRRKNEGTLLNNIGWLYDALGQPEEALKYYEDALDIREEIDHRAGLATTLNNIGKVYHDRGEYERALDCYERACPILEQLGKRKTLAALLCNIGAIYADQEYGEDALDCYRRSQAIAEELDDQEELGNVFRSIGSVYSDWGELEEALAYYQRAKSCLEKAGVQEHLALVFNNIGLVHFESDRAQEALEFYEQALRLWEDLEVRTEIATSLDNIGLAHQELEQWEQAMDAFGRAAALRAEMGDAEKETSIRYDMATIYRQQGRLAEAASALKRVVELDRQQQHPDLEGHEAALAEVEAELQAAGEGS